MTKKSLGRLQRDQEKKATDEALVKFEKDKLTNKAWDELKSIHGQIVSCIIGISSEVARMFSIPELNNFLENTKETSDLIRCVAEDTKSLSKRVASIYETHKDKIGGWNTEEEFFASVQIFEQYHAINSEISGLIFPNYNILTNHYTVAVVKAEEIVKKQKEENDLLNPNVVSDAEVKTQPTEDAVNNVQ